MLKALPAERWSFETAAHLFSRAGFGAPPEAIEELARLAPKAAVASFVEWERVPDLHEAPGWARPDPQRAEKLQAFRQATEQERQRLLRERYQEERKRVVELQYGWLERMANGPRPLQEKLTLFWHGHFATSILKVRDAYFMWRQNDLFRREGAGSWRTLLGEVTRDPAMLLWLDQARSKPARPNENYARELLELFTLGEGNYSEEDVVDAARALTGLTLNRLTQQPEIRARLRDHGEKTFLGHSGLLGVDQILDIIVSQPAADRFITAKLWKFFAGVEAKPEFAEALAEEFRRSDRNFAPFLAQMFLAEEFYSPKVVRQQIKSPVQLLIMACRQLERPLPPAPVCVSVLRLLGQELFNPPSVKGWDGGTAWINTNTLLTRHNLALLLVTGQNALPSAKRKPRRPTEAMQRVVNRTVDAVDLERLFTVPERADATRLLRAVEQRYLNAPLQKREQQALQDYLKAQGDLDDEDLLGLIRLTLCTPDYQLA